MELKNLKVAYHTLWFKEDHNTKVEVEKINISTDVCGRYFISPIGVKVYGLRWSWEEVAIKKLDNGLYALMFFSNSSNYVRSDEPFLILHLTKEEVCEWHSKDVWFSEEIHYVVRRKGKKFTGTDDKKRCIHCRYKLGKREALDHICKDIYYTVNEEMMTVEAVKS